MTTNNSNILQRAIFALIKEQPFLGNLFQEMNMRFSKQIPTAAIYYDKKTMTFNIIVNEEFFEKQTPGQRVGILLHELLHFTNGHLFRFEKVGTEKDHKMKNVAGDMAINQYIKDLPDGCVKVDVWKQKDGTPFPKFKTMETYYDLLKETTNEPEPKDGEGDPQGGKGKEKSAGGKGRSPGDDINYPEWEKYKEFDIHDWEELTDEEKQQILGQAKKAAQRAMDKTYNDYSLIPDSIKSFLEELKTKLQSLNYKAMFKHAAKRSLNSPDRVGSWNRPNKRYGEYSPGTTSDKVPSVNAYMDSSGSMSIIEMNANMEVLNQLLGAGHMRKCNIGFWHTSLYNFRKFRKDTPIKEDDVESGGTDPIPVLEHIIKTNPNLSVIFTDGYYDSSNLKPSQSIIWVISEGGQVDHPYKHIGLTFKINQLK